jgi:predicted negative regulator of RcsB-dependent stress response
VESYRTEEEQVEELRRWWKDNGRSTLTTIILALGVGFGWQGWQQHQETKQEDASRIYQQMLQAMSNAEGGAEQVTESIELAEQLKQDYSATTYAQFAALQLARMAVVGRDLAEAEAQLRWVLGQTDADSDTYRVAQLRLARVLAAKGENDQALQILNLDTQGPYRASYAIARGDTLLRMGRADEALAAYREAQSLAGGDGSQVNLTILEQKIQALSPLAPVAIESGTLAPEAIEPGASVEQGSMVEPATVTESEEG